MRTFQEEKTELEKQRSCEEEEYTYDYQRRKQRLEAELAEQKSKAEVDLLKQQVGNLESTVKNQTEEIAQLQTLLKEANTQVTRIAERAVSNRFENPSQSSQIREEKN